MSPAVVFEDKLEIPLLGDVREFRDWAQSSTFPEQGRVDFIAGRIEVDMSPEDLYRHGAVKVEIIRALLGRIKQHMLGELYADRTRVSCPDAELSVEPDIVFVSHESLEVGRVRLVAGKSGEPDQFVELEGAPDLIVEVVSDSSVRKDTIRLLAAYQRAGVREYWVVDARGEEVLFRLQVLGPTGYTVAIEDEQGFLYSPILNCRYRLERFRNKYGRLQYDLRDAE